jgi:hypothetical protein
MSILCQEITLGGKDLIDTLPKYISSHNNWIPNKNTAPELWGSRVDIKFHNGEITYDTPYQEWDWTIPKSKSFGGYNIEFYKVRKL